MISLHHLQVHLSLSWVFIACLAEVVKRATQLVCRAYTSVSLNTASALMGMPPDIVVQQNDWVVAGDMVSPSRPQPPSAAVNNTSSEEQLAKLTDFVSFLEN